MVPLSIGEYDQSFRMGWTWHEHEQDQDQMERINLRSNTPHFGLVLQSIFAYSPRYPASYQLEPRGHATFLVY